MNRKPVDLTRALGRPRAPDMAALEQGRIPFRDPPPDSPALTGQWARMIFPPWVYKLPMSQDFNVNVFTTVLAATAGTVVVPVSFTLPGGYVGYVQIMGIYVLSPTALTDITFALRINEGPVSGWDNIKPPPGVANFIVQNFADLQVRVPMSSKVDVAVTQNAATGPWTVGAKIAGWYHPQLEEQRLYGEL